MKWIFISVGVFIGLLVLLDAGFELLKTDHQVYMQYMRTRNVFQYEPGNVVYDPVLGYRLNQSLSVHFNNKEYKTTVHTNALGFRDDEASLQNPDVLFLGDSYVWGWGVGEQEDVEKQYEQLTHKKVLNMGEPGYGNVQELLLLYKWAKVMPPEGKSIVLFFCANDLYDNENTSFNAFPYFKESNGQLGFSSPSQDGFTQWQDAANKWMIHSAIAGKSMLGYECLSVIKNLQVKDIYKDYETDAARVNGGKAFIITAENLLAFSKKYNDRVTIVYVPPVSSYKGGGADKSYGLVKSVCGKLGLRFADLGSVLDITDYYPLDQHWKASGHRKAAVALAGF